MDDKFTIGLVQMKCTTNIEENLERATEKIQEAAARGAQIICYLGQFLGGGGGYRIREIKKFRVFGAAKVFAPEELMHADDLRAARCRFLDFLCGGFLVV